MGIKMKWVFYNSIILLILISITICSDSPKEITTKNKDENKFANVTIVSKDQIKFIEETQKENKTKSIESSNFTIIPLQVQIQKNENEIVKINLTSNEAINEEKKLIEIHKEKYQNQTQTQIQAQIQTQPEAENQSQIPDFTPSEVPSFITKSEKQIFS